MVYRLSRMCARVCVGESLKYFMCESELHLDGKV